MFWKLSAKVIKLQNWEIKQSFAEFFDDNRVDLFILFIELWHIKSSINFLLSHMLSYSSMRYRQIFDIIEFVCRFFTELQLRSKMKQLKRWMQKLYYYKSWEIDLAVESCWIFFAIIESLNLFYLLNLDLSKNNFLKNYSRALLLLNKNKLNLRIFDKWLKNKKSNNWKFDVVYNRRIVDE